ncbi:terminase small subunit [Exiguobacterium phage vB_EauM-23]|nr:terminase small subunit [Exiguobacterium phage vB_EauM-23]
MGKLTAKQKRFCDEYLVDLNATQAAIRAGYSEKTAKEIGCENLTKPHIRDYIDARLNEKERSLIASQEDVLRTLTNILSGDEMGSVLRGVGKGAQVIDEAPPTNTEKIRAAEILGKYYKLFTDRQEIEVKGAVQFIDDIGDDGG